MPKVKVRKVDQGTAFAAALQRYSDQGSRSADDAATMARLLEDAAQDIIGPAVSARLIWQGAQHLGLTSLEVNRLMTVDPQMASELMWIETDRPAPAGVTKKVRATLEQRPARKGNRS